MNKSIKRYNKYSLTVMILALLQIIGFFALPYAVASKEIQGIYSSTLGIPEFLSAFNIVRTLNNALLGDLFKGSYILIAAPVLCVIQLIVHGLGKTKAGHIVTIIFSILQTGVYAIGILIGELASGFNSMYESSIAGWIQIAMATCALVMSIIALASGSKRKVSSVPDKKKSGGVLIGVSGVYAGACIPVRDGETLVIGRDPRQCNIVLGSLSTSRKHCAITYDAYNNTYTVTDYSANGVFDKNGNRLEKGWKDLMRIGDEIRIANTVEVFRFGF